MPATPTTPETSVSPTPTPEGSLATGTDPAAPPVAAPEPFVPLTADALSIPEGFQVDEPLRDEFLGLVNNQELSAAERANGLLGLWTKGQEAFTERGLADFNAAQEAAVTEVKSDSTLGAANLPATLASMGKLMEEFGTPELRTLLDTTGAGNSIHMVRFLTSLAGKLTEGSINPPGSPPAGAEGSAAARMFPTMKG